MSRTLHNEEAMEVISPIVSILKTTGAWRPVPGKRHVAIVIEKDEELTLAPAPHDHTVIIVKANVQATIAEQATAAGTYLLLEQGARLKYLTQGSAQRFLYLEQDAQLDWIDIASGRSESTAYLAGTGAHAKFRSLFLGTSNEHYDVHVSMIHRGSRTTSNMLTRAALLDESTGTYRGLIRILPQASGCDAHQREDTLLLGDNAKMDAVPILEISNNDVKCSHGVALGQVDEEQLFYFESRGIARNDATTMIVQGFFDQLLISMGEYGAQVREEMLRKVQHA